MNGHITKRYAKALFEVVTEPAARDQAIEALTAFDKALAIKDPATGRSIGDMASARNVGLKIRKSMVRGLAEHMKLPKDLLSFVQILAERGRLSGLTLVIRQFRDLCDQALGRVRVSLQTATKLTPQQEQGIQNALAKATGMDVILDSVENPELIGGLVVHFKSLTVDRSVRRSLDEIRESFSVSALSAGAQT